MNKITFLLVLGTIQCIVAQAELTYVIRKTPQAHNFQKKGSQNFIQGSHSHTGHLSQLYRMPQQQRNEAIMAEVEMRQKQEEKYRNYYQGKSSKCRRVIKSDLF